MKFCFASALLFLSLSCRKEEGIWDQLSAAEQAAVRQRAVQACLNETNDEFGSFETASDGIHGNNASFPRHRSFKFTLTKSGDSEPTETSTIRVWKNDTHTVSLKDEIYLYVETTSGTSTTKYLFRSVDDVNLQMIEDMQEQLCDDQMTLLDDSPLSWAPTYSYTSGTSTIRETDTLYFDLAKPAMMGLFNRALVKRTYNSSGDQTASTSYTRSFTQITLDNFTTTDHTDLGVTQFCEPTVVAGSGKHELPYRLSVNFTCSPTVPVTWEPDP